MVKCCVSYNCKTLAGQGYSFFSFPKDETLCKAWVHAMYRADFKPTKHSKLCSKHFKPEDFEPLVYGYPRLKKDSVPSIFDFPKNIGPSPIKSRKPPALRNSPALPKSPALSESRAVPESNISLSATSGHGVASTASTSLNKSSKNKREAYLGDYSPEDLTSPRKAEKFLKLCANQMKKKKRIICNLRKQNKGLIEKVQDMQTLIDNTKTEEYDGAYIHPYVVLQKNAKDFKTLFDEGIKTCLDTWDMKIAELSSPQLLAAPENELDAAFSKVKMDVLQHMEKMAANLIELWVDRLSVIRDTFVENVDRFLHATKLVTETNIKVEAPTLTKKTNISPSMENISAENMEIPLSECVENMEISLSESVVDDPSPKRFKTASITPEVTCQPKQVDSLGEFFDVLREHEIQTCTKYVCIDSDKSFSEADFTPTENMKIHWNNDTPQYYIGRRDYACHLGKDTNVYKKKKYTEMRDSKVLIFNRNLAQPTRKLGCPVVIKVVRVLNLPRFKVSKVIRSQKDKMVKLIRLKLVKGEDIGGENAYRFTLPSEESHQNHNAAVKEIVDQSVRSSEIKELVSQGNNKIPNISELVEQFVENDLEETDESRSEFHPTIKCVRSIVKREHEEERSREPEQIQNSI